MDRHEISLFLFFIGLGIGSLVVSLVTTRLYRLSSYDIGFGLFVYCERSGPCREYDDDDDIPFKDDLKISKGLCIIALIFYVVGFILLAVAFKRKKYIYKARGRMFIVILEIVGGVLAISSSLPFVKTPSEPARIFGEDELYEVGISLHAAYISAFIMTPGTMIYICHCLIDNDIQEQHPSSVEHVANTPGIADPPDVMANNNSTMMSDTSLSGQSQRELTQPMAYSSSTMMFDMNPSGHRQRELTLPMAYSSSTMMSDMNQSGHRQRELTQPMAYSSSTMVSDMNSSGHRQRELTLPMAYSNSVTMSNMNPSGKRDRERGSMKSSRALSMSSSSSVYSVPLYYYAGSSVSGSIRK